MSRFRDLQRFRQRVSTAGFDKGLFLYSNPIDGEWSTSNATMASGGSDPFPHTNITVSSTADSFVHYVGTLDPNLENTFSGQILGPAGKTVTIGFFIFTDPISRSRTNFALTGVWQKFSFTSTPTENGNAYIDFKNASDGIAAANLTTGDVVKLGRLSLIAK